MTTVEPRYMQLAIDLSRNGLGTTSPNPIVGCVIVKDGSIVGTGFHEYAGGPHAEVMALKAAGERARGADVYVTLEPCSFYGRTPPCVEALIAHKVGRVIVAVRDPHPKVSGRGIEMLRAHGIKVVEGFMARQAAFVNRYYLTALTKSRPYVTVKLAATLDGFIADINGNSKWITSKAARNDVQELRRIHDAVLVGAGTFLVDRPKLTYRGGKNKRPELKRFVVTGSRETLGRVIEQRGNDNIYIAAPEDIAPEGMQIIRLKRKNGLVDLKDLLEKMHEMEIRSLLVEGGAKIAGNFIEENLFDEIVVYYAPKLLGNGKKLTELQKEYSIDKLLNFRLHGVQMIENNVKITLFNPEAFFDVYGHS